MDKQALIEKLLNDRAEIDNVIDLNAYALGLFAMYDALCNQEVREFEIWMEGYAATGEYDGAQMIGTGFGRTFDEAVTDYMSKNPESGIEMNGRGRYVSELAYQNRRSNWNIWACNLFDNEIDARKGFG